MSHRQGGNNMQAWTPKEVSRVPTTSQLRWPVGSILPLVDVQLQPGQTPRCTHFTLLPSGAVLLALKFHLSKSHWGPGSHFSPLCFSCQG